MNLILIYKPRIHFCFPFAQTRNRSLISLRGIRCIGDNQRLLSCHVWNLDIKYSITIRIGVMQPYLCNELYKGYKNLYGKDLHGFGVFWFPIECSEKLLFCFVSMFVLYCSNIIVDIYLQLLLLSISWYDSI